MSVFAIIILALVLQTQAQPELPPGSPSLSDDHILITHDIRPDKDAVEFLDWGSSGLAQQESISQAASSSAAVAAPDSQLPNVEPGPSSKADNHTQLVIPLPERSTISAAAHEIAFALDQDDCAVNIVDYLSLCQFLGKKPDPDEEQFMKTPWSFTTVRGPSSLGKPLVLWDCNRRMMVIDETVTIPQALSTLQKLILIARLYCHLERARRQGWQFGKGEGRVFNWITHVCVPVLGCLRNCCGNDLRIFQSRWGSPFAHSKFSHKCSGLDPYCGFEKLVADGRITLDLILDVDRDSIVRYQVRGFSTHTLLKCFRQFTDVSDHEDCTDGLREFLKETVRPIRKCLRDHCHDDERYFAQAFGQYLDLDRFRQQCCNGVAALCPAVRLRRSSCPSLSELASSSSQTILRPRSSSQLEIRCSSRRKTQFKIAPRTTAQMVLRGVIALFSDEIPSITDYESLCQLLRKSPEPEELQIVGPDKLTPEPPVPDNPFTFTVSGRVVVLHETMQIRQASNTLQKLIVLARLAQKIIRARMSDPGSIPIRHPVLRCLYSYSLPVLCCLVRCCRGDIRTFQARWGNPFHHHKFSKQCSRLDSRCGFERRLVEKGIAFNLVYDIDRRADSLLRYQIHGLETVTVIDCIRALRDRILSENVLCSASLQTFMTESVYPALNCLHHHFHDDIDLFCSVFGTHLNLKRFSERCCSGSTDQCPALLASLSNR